MNAPRWRVAAVGAMALLCVAPRDAAACSCMMSGPPCQEVWAADAVFAGTVTAIEPTSEGFDPAMPETFSIVRFDVQEAFVNGRPGPMELLSSENSTCAYRFRIGERYVVYARKLKSGRLTTGICSRTRRLSEAAEDLKYLRQMPVTSAGPRVYGRVNEWGREPADEQGVDYGPIPNLAISIRSGGFSQDVTTNRDGRYELTGVPLGKITVTFTAPPGFGGSSKAAFEITDVRACVEANFTMSAQATATGVVIGADGRPAAGVMVDAVAAELAGYLPPRFQEPVKTNERGEFTFERLPPGEYVFGINLATPRWASRASAPVSPQIFHPGTTAADRATIVELKPGDEKDLGVLKLPPP